MDIYTFQLFANYQLWATQRLNQTLVKLSDKHFHQACGLFFESIFGTLNHLLVADDIWYSRFQKGISLKLSLSQTLELDRNYLLDRLESSCLLWQKYINTLNPDQLNGQIHYTNTRNQKMILPFAPTLFHVFNHATHHRGQITAAITQFGYDCPELDLIFMLMEEQQAYY